MHIHEIKSAYARDKKMHIQLFMRSKMHMPEIIEGFSDRRLYTILHLHQFPKWLNSKKLHPLIHSNET